MTRQYILQVVVLLFIFNILGSCTKSTGAPGSTKEPEPMATQDASFLLKPIRIMEMTPIQPRPNYIQAVSPKEYSIVPLDIYRYSPAGIEIIGSATDNPEEGYQSTICLRVSSEPLAEEGDDLTPLGEMEKRMALYVNYTQMEMTGSVLKTLPVIHMPENPDDVRTAWLTPADYCWKAPLTLGQHQIEFTFQQTSGKVEHYTWVLEIVE
ncbi:hypothetical protein [Candidatus Leptofilum sp.]|uniref:hypothetical protein n=1 Tax=Candidatus Leptofilum sp. TaxID=3241576 RepID=UPI003B5B014B